MFPWSTPPHSTTVDASHAVHKCIPDAGSADCSKPDVVGSRAPKGDGRWGQSDLGGSLWERTLDWYHPYVTPCIDCANLTPGQVRVLRGGSWATDSAVARTSFRNWDYPVRRQIFAGFRCARDG